MRFLKLGLHLQLTSKPSLRDFEQRAGVVSNERHDALVGMLDVAQEASVVERTDPVPTSRSEYPTSWGTAAARTTKQLGSNAPKPSPQLVTCAKRQDTDQTYPSTLTEWTTSSTREILKIDRQE